MRIHSIATAFFVFFLLVSAAAGASITDSTVSGTNIYADSTVYNIGPVAEIDSTSTADGITNIADRYLYIEGITATATGNTSTFSTIGQQGAAVNVANQGTELGTLWDYGDEESGTANTHTYEEYGIYDISLTATSYLDSTGITVTGRTQIGDTTITASINRAEISTGSYWVLSAETQNALSVSWQVMTPDNSAWQAVSGTTYKPTAYGTHYFRATATGLTQTATSETLTGEYVISIQNNTVTGTNVYSGANSYDIGPAGSYTGSTADGITNIAGRYVYASGLAYTQAAQIVTYSIATRQGAAVITANQGAELGMYWDYGDGNSATTEELTHRYRTPSTYITTLQLSSYLQETPTTITTSVSLATSGAIDNAVSNTNVYAGSRLYDIAPSAYLKGGNSATGITNIAGRYLYASDLTAALSGSTATITAADRQGAAVNTTTQGTTGTYSWDYGDGATATTTATDSTTHTYSTGIYSAKVEIPGYFGNLILYTDPINVGVPTYTAEDITTQDFDIVVEAGQLYQPLTQYILPSTKADMEFFAGNLFVLASGRTVYTIDAGTATATPVSTTTGTTAETIYLGENAAIITDTAGNTAVYVYEAGTFAYLSSGGSDKIATTANYAGIVNDGTLSVYDLSTGKKIGSTPANIEAFAGNDYGDTFAGYNGSTISYWWVDNAGAIQSGSANITQTVTGLKQIAQTENYIVTTDTNTLIIGVSGVGEYNLVATSETDTPLTTPQATTIGVIIGVHSPNEIYIIGADGATAGTYQTGAALADSSISKATGLYAITGGADQQTYILRKDQESTWSLAQIVKANAGITHTQISTTGNYAAIISGVNMYVLKISTQPDTNYYLQGMVIDSSGKPYKGIVYINGEKVNSDASGKFTYPVVPGTLYEIVVETTTTEYTATNAALQQIAIKLSVDPLATDIQYSAEYNAATQSIEMSYYDMADKTTSVTWEIRQTNNNTVVATFTGNTASYPVPIENNYQNYYVKVVADRGDADITKSWSITPAGGFPVDLFGLDENGKNIIFGFLLLIIAGLFGAMHSTRGAILTAFAACILRYLELITIPWIVILVATVLAVVAAIAGGQR